MPPDKPFSALLKYRNTDTVFTKIVPIDSVNNKIIKRNAEHPKGSYKMLSNAICSNYKLSPENDHLEHAVEIPLSSLKKGRYMLIASNNRDFDCNPGVTVQAELQVTSYTLSSGRFRNGYPELLVTDRIKGSPLKDARIRLFQDVYSDKTKKSSTECKYELGTDKNGIVHFEGKSGYYRFLIEDVNDTLRDWASLYYAGKKINEENREKVFLFTDRAIYRPGQKIYFNGIVLDMRAR